MSEKNKTFRNIHIKGKARPGKDFVSPSDIEITLDNGERIGGVQSFQINALAGTLPTVTLTVLPALFNMDILEKYTEIKIKTEPSENLEDYILKDNKNKKQPGGGIPFEQLRKDGLID